MKLRRNFLEPRSFGTFLRRAAAPQYSSEAALCRAEGLKTAVGGLPRKAATFGVFVLGGTGLIGAAMVR